MSNNSLDNIELRSEEIQEIITQVPHWVIRWGNVLFLSLIILLLCISWFIKYPDTIVSEAIITTQTPLEKEFAQVTSKIHKIFVVDNQEVKQNQPLAILENTANFEDVFRLKSIIDTVTVNRNSFSFPIDSLPILFLGEIQSQFTFFENSYLNYKLYSELQPYSNQSLANKNTTELNQRLRSLKLQQNTNRVREEMTLLKTVIQSFNQLKKVIKDWEHLYVLKSNINGKVAFLNYWDKNQTVKQGELIFVVIPIDSSSFIAKLKTPAQNSGKIKIGQRVNIKLENYPNTEFGVLNGKIKNISLIPNSDGFYYVAVELPKNLITSYNKKIHLKQEMRGSAEIILEDLRLTERFFYQFKKLIE